MIAEGPFSLIPLELLKSNRFILIVGLVPVVDMANNLSLGLMIWSLSFNFNALDALSLCSL
jgi:hypothetical protein